MSSIKIGYDDKGNLLHTLCNGKPESPEFYYTDEKGACKNVKDPIAVEFSQENLKKILSIFGNQD